MKQSVTPSKDTTVSWECASVRACTSGVHQYSIVSRRTGLASASRPTHEIYEQVSPPPPDAFVQDMATNTQMVRAEACSTHTHTHKTDIQKTDRKTRTNGQTVDRHIQGFLKHISSPHQHHRTHPNHTNRSRPCNLSASFPRTYAAIIISTRCKVQI